MRNRVTPRWKQEELNNSWVWFCCCCWCDERRMFNEWTAKEAAPLRWDISVGSATWKVIALMFLSLPLLVLFDVTGKLKMASLKWGWKRNRNNNNNNTNKGTACACRNADTRHVSCVVQNSNRHTFDAVYYARREKIHRSDPSFLWDEAIQQTLGSGRKRKDDSKEQRQRFLFLSVHTIT